MSVYKSSWAILLLREEGSCSICMVIIESKLDISLLRARRTLLLTTLIVLLVVNLLVVDFPVT